MKNRELGIIILVLGSIGVFNAFHAVFNLPLLQALFGISFGFSGKIIFFMNRKKLKNEEIAIVGFTMSMIGFVLNLLRFLVLT